MRKNQFPNKLEHIKIKPAKIMELYIELWNGYRQGE